MTKREQVFIGGAWVSADTKARFDVTNPATGEVIGTAPLCGRKETARAIDHAYDAFQSWRESGAEERSALLYQIYEGLMDNQGALGELLTVEMGKPLAEAKGEIVFSAKFFKWFAEETRRIYGDIIPSPWGGKRIAVTKHPVGVVGAITPWNFPSSMIARKLSAALAAGCAMVIKPASQTPYSALAYGDIVKDAGAPDGLVNIITGRASHIAAEMCENPKLRKISFTGSTEIGKQLAANASANMKRISMELGGHAPFIIFDDADLDAAVDGAMISKFRNAGQTCVCANRFLVQAGVYDAFAEKFAAAIDALKVGDGREAGVTQGPLIDESAVAKSLDHIDDARSHGAQIKTGGRSHALGGLYFEPTLLTDVPKTAKIFREETFGPVAPLFRFQTEEEAIALANDSNYGLACYAYTRDLGRAWRLSDKLEYGMVGINEGLVSTEVAPFGGVKDSGLGNEGSKYGLDDYLDIKYSLFGGLTT